MIIASIYPFPFDIQDRHEFNSTVLTDSIGFSGENGKTSGLASYGKVQQKLKDEINKLISVTKEHGAKFKRKRFSKTEVNLKKILYCIFLN